MLTFLSKSSDMDMQQERPHILNPKNEKAHSQVDCLVDWNIAPHIKFLLTWKERINLNSMIGQRVWHWWKIIIIPVLVCFFAYCNDMSRKLLHLDVRIWVVLHITKNLHLLSVTSSIDLVYICFLPPLQNVPFVAVWHLMELIYWKVASFWDGFTIVIFPRQSFINALNELHTKLRTQQ